MICDFCGYEFDDSCGPLGCPNCLGEGLKADSGHRKMVMHPKQTKYNKASQDRKREAGLVRVERWVHKTRKAELDAVIAELQKPAKNANADH
jgi:hypothetical protein